jgi:hypothetical protein
VDELVALQEPVFVCVCSSTRSRGLVSAGPRQVDKAHNTAKAAQMDGQRITPPKASASPPPRPDALT